MHTFVRNATETNRAFCWNFYFRVSVIAIILSRYDCGGLLKAALFQQKWKNRIVFCSWKTDREKGLIAFAVLSLLALKVERSKGKIKWVYANWNAGKKRNPIPESVCRCVCVLFIDIQCMDVSERLYGITERCRTIYCANLRIQTF